MVTKMNYLCTLMVVILSLQHAYVVSARPPNMVIIILDDVGYGDLGSYWNPTGQRSNTPFLDYMASKGIRFTDFHSPGSVCVPSRSSMLTGRMCVRTGFPNRIPDDVIGGLPFNETIIAETFKAAGYRTGLIGKWGSLGVSPKYHPNSRGFDLFYGLPDSNNHGCTLEAGGTTRPRVCPSSWSDIPGYTGTRCSLCSSSNYIGDYAVPLYHNRIIVEQPVNQTTLSLRYSQMAAEFVKDGSQPYLLYVALAHMHAPLFHMPEFEGRSASNSVYGDTLLEMDNTIETIVQAIKESGEEENTLIWVASDNGPDEIQCQFGGSPGPFTGVWQTKEGGGGSTSKSSPYEGGHRVPSIVYWPGTIEGGQVSDALVSGMDIYPTMAALANIQMPGNRNYDGIDISDLLLGRPFHGRRVLYHSIASRFDGVPQCDIHAVRVGDYKAIFVTGGQLPDCEGNYGILERHSPPLMFNVIEDPAEASPLDPNSTVYGSVLEEVSQAMTDIERSVQMDRTPTQEWIFNTCAIPCCNALNVACRCY